MRVERLEKVSKCCKTAPPRSGKKVQSSWLPAILVAILPKCPFCIMAYSGAVTMCSGNNLYPHAGSYMSYITLLLALIIIIGIGFNFKGRRTYWALATSGLGMMLILLSQFIFLSSFWYYFGSSLLFLGIWLNGSLFSLVNQLKTRIYQP